MAADLQPCPATGRGTAPGTAAPGTAVGRGARAGSAPGELVSTPCAWSGTAVTGPTQAGSTSWPNAASSSGSRPDAPRARPSRETAAGALVKGHGVHAPRRTAASSSRSTGPRSSWRQPPVHGHAHHLGPAPPATPPRTPAAAHRAVVRRSGGPPRPAPGAVSRTSAIDSDGGRPPPGQSGGPHRALDLGPARQQLHRAQPRQQRPRRAPSRRRPRSSPGTRWRWWRRRRRVPGRRCGSVASSSPSSASGTIRSAGACRTLAPRRCEQRAQFVGPAGGVAHAHGEPGQRAVAGSLLVSSPTPPTPPTSLTSSIATPRSDPFPSTRTVTCDRACQPCVTGSVPPMSPVLRHTLRIAEPGLASSPPPAAVPPCAAGRRGTLPPRSPRCSTGVEGQKGDEGTGSRSGRRGRTGGRRG